MHFVSLPLPVLSQRCSSAPQALEIDSEDELQRLVDFFLKFKAQEAPLGQVGLRRQQWGEPTLREGEAEHHLNPQGSIFRGASRACGKKMRLRGCEDLLQSFPGPLTHEMLPKLPKYAKAAGGWKPKVAFGDEEVVEGHRAQPPDLPSTTREARVEKMSRIWGRTERAARPVSSNLLRDHRAPFHLPASMLTMSSGS